MLELEETGSVTHDHIDIIDAATSHNDDLPDDAKRVTRLLLRNAHHDLASIDAAISLTSGPPAPDDLLARRMHVEERIKSYQTAIAPHRKLPTELLREIFMEEAEEHFFLPIDSLHDEFPLQWHVSHVCSKWRHIVLEIPELWNKAIVSYYERHTSQSHLSTTNLTAEILKRTFNSESLILLTVRMGYLKTSNDPIAMYVIPNLSHLGSFTIDSSLDMLTPFLTLPPDSVEALKCLSIGFTDYHSRYPITVFKGARSLRIVRLSYQDRGKPTIDIFAFHFPWSQLTYLEMFEFNIPTSKALVLLQRCLSLEDLTFSCTGKWWPLKVPPQSSIALPHMESLSICIEGEDEWGQWLGAFSFPHLVQLEFVGNWDPVLAPVITSSELECLKELRLCIPIPAADMDAILRRGWFLETLDLPSDSLSRSAGYAVPWGMCSCAEESLLCRH
jgi:hypothetical protein